MALVVDKTIKFLNVPDAENFTIQCSKPMEQLTVDDVKSADFWVGFTSFANNQMFEGNVESGLPQNDPNHCWCWATNDSAMYNGDWSTAHWSYPANYPSGIYMRNILVECALAHSQFTSLQNNASARIIMNIEAGEDTKLQNLFIEGSSYITCIYNEGQSTQNQVTDNRYIKPAVLMIVNDVLYVWIQGFEPRMSMFFCNSENSQGYASSQCFDDFARLSNHFLGMSWTRALETGNMYTDSGQSTDVNFNYTVPDVDFNGVTADLKVSLGSSNYHKRASLSIIDNEDKEIEKYYKAFTGFRFKVDNVWYKPIVEGGIVTGYTDDMTVLSEWDEWDNITGHNVPITPPTPPSGEDDKFESMTTGFSSAIGGITKYYKMSQSGLISLINDFNQHAPAGTTISNSIVSLYVNALDNSWTTVNTPIEIHTAGAQETPFTSVLEYPELYLFANPMKQLGYIDVPRVTNTFYDYNPYTTYELYIPFCGWIGLPDTIAGRRLRVELHVDLATMNCRAFARCEVDNGHGYDSTLCGEISGAIGAPCPLEIIEGGLYRQSFVNSALQLVSGGTMAIVGGMSGANALMASGAMNAIQGLANARMAGNTNYTQVVGRSGDCSGLAGAHKCYLKISHPVVDKVVETSLFGHSVGYICDTVDKLKNFKGFTVCLNPHITINATQAEKEEIKRLLEDGVIL